jgi:Cu/Zn superoxide dismutase
LNENNQRQTVSVKLLDAFGRTQIETQFTHSRSESKTKSVKFNVSNLPEGTYYLHIEHNGKTHKEQIIIKRN